MQVYQMKLRWVALEDDAFARLESRNIRLVYLGHAQAVVQGPHAFSSAGTSSAGNSSATIDKICRP